MTSLLWFRRDLRLHDHPALDEAARSGPVVALFVLDPALLGPSGPARRAWLFRALRALDSDLQVYGTRLLIRTGDPVEVVPAVAAEAGATSVHVSADFNPYGTRRDESVERALAAAGSATAGTAASDGAGPATASTGIASTDIASTGIASSGIAFVRTGSPYAVAPGRVLKSDGEPYKVYTPYFRAWTAHGWRKPAATDPAAIDWFTGILTGTGPAALRSEPIPDDPELPEGQQLPDAGESAALATWRGFRSQSLRDYGEGRNRPDTDATSRMSVYLKWGCVHPRTLLADLAPADEIYRKELAWREFYATILHHFPDSARDYFQPQLKSMTYADADSEAFRAWCEGRTGYPIVDAGMRQLRAQAWMHNRLRMIVASFLVKDLHIEWQHGAREFMRYLCDGDLASNQHGWQWVAGSGTDASPFFRIFNPVGQGQKFDPDGDYVRRWVPELRGIAGAAVHEPWTLPDPPAGYPAPIVDHKRERAVALDRYQQVRA